MKTLLIFGALWCGADSADVVTDHIAVVRVQAVEHNPIMSHVPAERYAVTYGSAAVGASISAYLWTHQHKRLAVAVTALDIVARGFIARHNWIEGHP